MPERMQDQSQKRERARVRRQFPEYADELEEPIPPDEEEDEEKEIDLNIAEEDNEETSYTMLDVLEEPQWDRPYVGGNLKIALKVLKTFDGYLAIPTLLRPSWKVTLTLKSVCDALNEVLAGYFPFEHIQKPEELGVIAKNVNRRFSLELGVELPDGSVYPFSAFIPKGRPSRLWILRHDVRKWISENKERFTKECVNEPFDKVMRWMMNHVSVKRIEDLEGLLHPIWRRLKDGKKKERKE